MVKLPKGTRIKFMLSMVKIDIIQGLRNAPIDFWLFILRSTPAYYDFDESKEIEVKNIIATFRVRLRTLCCSTLPTVALLRMADSIPKDRISILPDPQNFYALCLNETQIRTLGPAALYPDLANLQTDLLPQHGTQTSSTLASYFNSTDKNSQAGNKDPAANI